MSTRNTGGTPVTPRRPGRGTRPHPVWRLLRGVFVVLDLLLLVLIGVGYAASYLHPASFWWAALVGVWLPYLAMVFVPATLLALLFRVRRLWFAHAVVLVLLLLRFVPASLLEGTPEPGEEDLVLMTFNAPLTGPSADDLARDMLGFVRREQPDLITFQESTVWMDSDERRLRASHHIAGLIDSLDYSSYVPRRFGRRYAIHQPILERSVDIVEQSQLLLRDDPDDVDRTYVVRTRFRWKGREAVLYNVHLRTYGRDKPWENDMRLMSLDFWKPFLRMYRANYQVRAREIDQIHEMIAAETLPIIVSGDLNSTPHNWEYRRLADDLTDTFREAGRGWGGTWHSRLPLVRIDHVLVSEEWEVVSARVPDVRLSDHRPLVVRLRWREPVQERS